MSDGSFEKVEEVATQRKNEEDTAALELAGQTTEDFTFLAEASHLDVQKSLADLEEAIAKLSTKDTAIRRKECLERHPQPGVWRGHPEGSHGGHPLLAKGGLWTTLQTRQALRATERINQPQQQR